MGEISKITKGVDLTHPRLSVGWILGGIVAVVLLLAIVAAGTWFFTKGKEKIAPALGQVTGGVSALVD